MEGKDGEQRAEEDLTWPSVSKSLPAQCSQALAVQTDREGSPSDGRGGGPAPRKPDLCPEVSLQGRNKDKKFHFQLKRSATTASLKTQLSPDARSTELRGADTGKGHLPSDTPPGPPALPGPRPGGGAELRGPGFPTPHNPPAPQAAHQTGHKGRGNENN